MAPDLRTSQALGPSLPCSATPTVQFGLGRGPHGASQKTPYCMAAAASHFPIGINRYDRPQGRSPRPSEVLHGSIEAVSSHEKKRSPCHRLFVDVFIVSFICTVSEPGKIGIRPFLYKCFSRIFTIFFEFSSKNLFFCPPAQLSPIFSACSVAL